MKHIRNIGFLFLIIFASAQDSKTEKVLFVGNSFTFYFNLPLVVESMADEKGIGLDVYQSTAGGSSLKDHWIGKRNLSTKSKIQNGNFDKIILQDYSTNPVNKTIESLDYFNRFIDLATSVDAKVYIYRKLEIAAQLLLMQNISPPFHLISAFKKNICKRTGT